MFSDSIEECAIHTLSIKYLYSVKVSVVVVSAFTSAKGILWLYGVVVIYIFDKHVGYFLPNQTNILLCLHHRCSFQSVYRNGSRS